MTKVHSTTRTTIFTPVASMPQDIRGAAISLGAPEATSEEIVKAADQLRIYGQKRGARLHEVKASAVALVEEVYSRLMGASITPREARRLAAIRLKVEMPGGNGPSGGGSTWPSPEPRQRSR